MLTRSRASLAVLVTMAAAALNLTVTGTSYALTGLPSNGTSYNISSEAGGGLQVAGPGSGSSVKAADWHPDWANEQWTLKDVGNGHWTIGVPGTNNVADRDKSANSVGSWNYVAGADNQQWWLQNVGGESWLVHSAYKGGNDCLHRRADLGVDVQPCNSGDAAQRWHFDAAPGATSGGTVSGGSNAGPSGSRGVHANNHTNEIGVGDVSPGGLSDIVNVIDKIFTAFGNSSKYEGFVNSVLDETDQAANHKYNIVAIYNVPDFYAKNILSGNLQGGPGVNNTPYCKARPINDWSYQVCVFDHGKADFNSTIYPDGSGSQSKAPTFITGPGFVDASCEYGGFLGTVSSYDAYTATFASRQSQPLGGDSMLAAGQTLNKGQHITSPNGHTLDLQNDGNLVEYPDASMTPGTAIHTTGTYGSTQGDHLTMQWDGNLVLYDANNQHALWATATNGNQNAWAQIQDTGDLAIFNSGNNQIWSIGTKGWPLPLMRGDGAAF
ncbi:MULTISPECIES: hypothetical protein [unclassified Streptomyces]|uniref:hypothetical protein n=1 Tax=unclassified Streptomyces TaxID=2593676 RepID=UPI003805CAA3